MRVRHIKKKRIHRMRFLVWEGGFEPPKSSTTDLQSAPFGHSGIPPYECVVGLQGLEPRTDRL